VPRRVNIAIGVFRSYGEPVREGIARFGRTRPGWVYDGYADAGQILRLSDADLRGIDGFLGAYGSTALRQRLTASGRPAVDMLHGGTEPDIPAVFSDEAAIGALAVDHLADAGITRLYVLYEPTAAGTGRAAGARSAATDRGIAPDVISVSGVDHVPALQDLLAAIDTPLGVFCTSDGVAIRVLHAAAAVGLRVPDDLAVVGVNDSVLMCGFSEPPLSSVRPDWERIGFEAAALLQRLMDGQPPPDGPELIPPLGVTVRQSSDVLAIDDDEVVRAVRWIRDHASEPGNVGDLLAAVPAARRSLERKFRGAFGHSPFQELRRQQVEHVKQLLIHTDWAMPKVAANSAFRDAKDLATQFRKYAGTTPTTYRAQHRSR